MGPVGGNGGKCDARGVCCWIAMGQWWLSPAFGVEVMPSPAPPHPQHSLPDVQACVISPCKSNNAMLSIELSPESSCPVSPTRIPEA